MFNTTGFKLALPLLITLTMSACDSHKKSSNNSNNSTSSSSSSSSTSSSSSSSSGIPGPDTTGPVLNISFPTAVSATNGDKITLRGTVSDQSAIAEVFVNGKAVTSSDNFANWQISIDNLSIGNNSFTVTAKDALNQPAELRTVQVKRYIEMLSPMLTAVNDIKQEAYVFDTLQKAVIGINMNTGERRLLSTQTSDTKTSLNTPLSMVLDAAHNRLLISDRQQTDSGLIAAIITVDLTSGERSLFKQGPAQTTADDTAAMALRQPTGLTIDTDANKLYIYDTSGNVDATTKLASFTLSSIDLASNEQKIVSSLTLPDALNPPGIVPLIKFDKAGKTILYITNTATTIGLYAFNLATGARTEVIDPKLTDTTYTNRFVSPADLAINGNFAWVVDNYRYSPTGNLHAAQIYQVDLTTGARTALADNLLPDQNYATRRVQSLNVNSTGTELFLTDSSLDALFSLNLETLKKSVITSNLGLQANTRLKPLVASSLVFDDRTQHLYVADASLGEILNLDLATSNISSLSNLGVSEVALRNFTNIIDMALDKDKNRLLTLASYIYTDLDSNGQPLKDTNGAIKQYVTPTLQEVSLSDGTAKIISGHTTPDPTKMVNFTSPQTITFDKQKNLALIFDPKADVGGYNFPSMITVDLTEGVHKGERKGALSNFSYVDLLCSANSDFYLFLDYINRSAYISLTNDVNTDATLRTFSTNSPEQTELLKLPQVMALDEKRNRVIVVDNEGDRILGIDINTGERTLLANSVSSNGFNKMRQVKAMDYNSTANVAYVTDSISNTVIAVDLTTGERAVISQ